MQLALSKNAASLRKRKRRLLTALFHFVAKVRQFANPRLLIKAVVVEFIGMVFAKARDKIDTAFTAEDAFSAIMEVVFFIQSETNHYLSTECIELLYSLIRKSDTTEIPKGFLQNLYILKEKLAKDMYSLNILQEIEAHYRI